MTLHWILIHVDTIKLFLDFYSFIGIYIRSDNRCNNNEFDNHYFVIQTQTLKQKINVRQYRFMKTFYNLYYLMILILCLSIFFRKYDSYRLVIMTRVYMSVCAYT